MNKARLWIAGIVLLLLSFALPASAQQPHSAPARPEVGAPHAHDEASAALEEMQRKAARQRQKERFERIKRDSEQLLALATELKQYVDRTGEDVLSLEVVRKAEEMEKLARRVKNDMRGE